MSIQTEALTDSLVAASERRDYFKERADQQQADALELLNMGWLDTGQLADALLAVDYPADEWPDGPPGEGEMDTAREQAEAVIPIVREALRAVLSGGEPR